VVANVLLVEDDDNLRDSISAVLGLHGHDVRAKANGLDALEIMQTWMPDLIVSDIDMPGMNGLELAERTKSNPLFAHLPFVAISALDGRTCKAVDVFLHKPVHPSRLLRVVDHAA
jgi:two-component system, sensor histidine kinase and response regulator